MEQDNNCNNDAAIEADQSQHYEDPIIDNEIPSVISFSANRQVLKGDVKIHSLPPLPSVTDEDFESIFREKIIVCNLIFDFDHPSIQLDGKKIKKRTLREINALITRKAEARLIPQELQALLLQMISKNIFEQDPFVSLQLTQSDSKLVDPSWPHLELVFIMLNNFVQVFPEVIEMKHVEKAIYLLNLPDPKNRDGLICFLLTYLKFHPEHLIDIWDLMKIGLSNAIDGIYTPYCIQPILIFIFSVFNTNRSKVRPLLRQILFPYLMPLFHQEKLPLFSTALTSIVFRTVDGCPQAQIQVIDFLIKSFPRQNGKKQHLFVNSISNIMKAMNTKDFRPKAKQIIEFIGNCIKLPNSKLTEAILHLFTGKNLAPIIAGNAQLVLSTLYTPLIWAANYYWDRVIRDQADLALSIVKRMSSSVYNPNDKIPGLGTEKSPGAQLKNFPHATSEHNNDLIKNWALISREAAKNDRDFDLTDALQRIHSTFLKDERFIEVTKPLCSSRVPAYSTPLSKVNATVHAQSQLYGRKIL